MAPEQDQKIGQTVQEVTERMSVLVREEIELAKAEVTVKAKKLGAAAAVGLAGGIFFVVALLFLIQSLAWLLAQHLFSGNVWLGFLVTAGILVVLGVLAALLAYRFVKAGTPPTPKMAIEEAKLIKDTVRS